MKFDVFFYKGYLGKKRSGVYNGRSMDSLARTLFGKDVKLNYIHPDDAQVILNGVLKARISVHIPYEELATGQAYMDRMKKEYRSRKHKKMY